MSEKKPKPTVSRSGQICPICGNRTYSQGGIHPQCAVAQADAARAEKLKKERKRKDEKATKAKPSTWRNKKCPNCDRESHVRKKVCECGHKFF